MQIRAAVAEGGIEVEVVQAETAVDGSLIESISLDALGGGPDYKKSTRHPVGVRNFHGVIEIHGLGNTVTSLIGFVRLAGHEDEPVIFNLQHLTDELQLCVIDGGGPVGINSICSAAGICCPSSK